MALMLQVQVLWRQQGIPLLLQALLLTSVSWISSQPQSLSGPS
jgi:hypothetical protein